MLFSRAGPYPDPMRVRGNRECRECGEQWSYFETGSPSCPACGSLSSRAVDDERTRHTDAPVELSLESAAGAIDEHDLTDLAERAADACRRYVSRRGFLDAGELRPLDDRYLAAAELRAVGDHLTATMEPDPAAEAYFYDLLAAAPDGGRPEAEAVPRSLRGARGLAVAECVGDYRRAVARWLADRDREGSVPELGQLATHERRMLALDGEVEPQVAETLVAAARDLGTAATEDDPAARERATARLAGLDGAVD